MSRPNIVEFRTFLNGWREVSGLPGTVIACRLADWFAVPHFTLVRFHERACRISAGDVRDLLLSLATGSTECQNSARWRLKELSVVREDIMRACRAASIQPPPATLTNIEAAEWLFVVRQAFPPVCSEGHDLGSRADEARLSAYEDHCRDLSSRSFDGYGRTWNLFVDRMQGVEFLALHRPVSDGSIDDVKRAVVAACAAAAEKRRTASEAREASRLAYCERQRVEFRRTIDKVVADLRPPPAIIVKRGRGKPPIHDWSCVDPFIQRKLSQNSTISTAELYDEIFKNFPDLNADQRTVEKRIAKYRNAIAA